MNRQPYCAALSKLQCVTEQVRQHLIDLLGVTDHGLRQFPGIVCSNAMPFSSARARIVSTDAPHQRP